MAFFGRSAINSLIDQLVRTGGGPQVAPELVRPVLILEGSGGSGRSKLLKRALKKWSHRTPVALVDGRAMTPGDSPSVQDVVLAIMLGLSPEAPGYKTAFPRTTLALIAMAGPLDEPGADQRVEAMNERLDVHQDRAQVADLLTKLIEALGGLVPLPGMNIATPAIAHVIVGRLSRGSLRTRLTWHDSLDWFGHQDQDLHHEPIRALVRLNIQAQSDSVSVRQDVNHLLVAALLADLRESFDRAANHPTNALLLLDDGDVPAATEFVTTLVDVRNALARNRMPADPLTFVTTSGGPLTSTLDGPGSPGPRWDESKLDSLSADDVHRAGPWLAIRLGGLAFADVQDMARDRTWPYSLGTGVVASTVHRLCDGHAAATGLVLDALQESPELVDELSTVLSRPAPRPGITIEQHLVDRFVAGLSPSRHIDQRLREDLVTVAAARDNYEARQLAPLMGNPADAESALFTSTPLWSAAGRDGRSQLAPFPRLLLLRALARRPNTHPAAWAVVFKRLRANVQDDDIGGILHHELALDHSGWVVDKLDRLWPQMSGADWLVLLDAATGTPALGPQNSHAETPHATEDERHAHVRQILTAKRSLADTLLSDRDMLRHLNLIAAHAFRQLATKDLRLFIARAQHHQKLADALA